MGKRNVMVSIEDYIHDKAKARGLNVSALCEDILRQVLESFNKNVNPETCKHDWTWPFATPRGLVKECKKCGSLKKVIVESYEETAARYEK